MDRVDNVQLRSHGDIVVRGNGMIDGKLIFNYLIN